MKPAQHPAAASAMASPMNKACPPVAPQRTERESLRVRIPRLLCALLVFLASANTLQADGRSTLNLDGRWSIADSKEADAIPATFPSEVPVPGLVNLAKPAFPNVDEFISRENLANRIRAKLSPASWLQEYSAGKVNQDRNYFWYQRKFKAPKARDAAILKVNKAQFGTAVWLNGVKVGSYDGCFSAGYFDLTRHLRWGEDNTLLIRIGAHPAVLPDTWPTGSDFEKIKWTPGIYDSVSLICGDNPIIESVQVAPRISTGEVVVQTRLRNYGGSVAAANLEHSVRAWKGGKTAAKGAGRKVTVPPGETLVLTNTLVLEQPRLWSPEDPFLYVLETATGTDSLKTRFGMREFTFDPRTKRALLNGKPYFLRGSNITLHRFFEDPLCQDLPWNEKWLRKLLGELPKEMNWNYFRFCIGPVPDQWLDLCDELGLMIQNEFFVWTGGPGWYAGYSRKHDAPEMIRQYKDWMRDNWNHPSVVVWDANNETKDDIFHTQIIPAVRPLDLSGRPWENSYNPPVGPNDPVEAHPYLMISGFRDKLTFNMTDLEKMDGKPRKGDLPSERHTPLINEYGWLWLNRDGTPTSLTENLYPQLLGTNSTARQRLDLYSYLLAGKTEFWRAHRQFAGIIHFVYLTCSYPGVYTADHFADVQKLKLDPAFADYMGEAFKPLGVYLNFFQPKLQAGASRDYTIKLINDHDTPRRGTLVLSFRDAKGRTVAKQESAFSMSALGDQTLTIRLGAPNTAGNYTLQAQAKASKSGENTLSRRWVQVE